MNRTPLHPAHVALGARLVDFAGWEMPIQYTTILEEHRAVREAAGLFDVSHMGDLIVRGPGAEDGLRSLMTNDIKGLPEGKGIYSHLLDDQGHIIDDTMTFHMLPGTFLHIPNAATTPSVRRWIEERISAEVIDVSEQVAALALQGPRSAAILQHLTGSDVQGLKRMHGNFMTLNVDGTDGKAFLPDVLDIDAPSEGVQAYVMRSGYTGEDGFEILVDPSAAVAVWDAILSEGERHGIRPCGLGARDLLRLEMGFLLSGTDFDGTQSTLQTGPRWALKWEHDFIGKEALLEQRERPCPKLVGLELLEKGIPRHGHIVRANGKDVGKVTSGSMSPLLGKGIALAYVGPGCSSPGQELEVIIRDRPVRAKVVMPPFIGKR
ncbi:MAG TPA: glycine cleavage system aminomethyltransferase GcvT [Methanomassiliicoccaceae archaeon]|nr:glycine cleavage system aminomethyltransferase GcvT [Methanomassiliicoccaceae archaeon]